MSKTDDTPRDPPTHGLAETDSFRPRTEDIRDREIYDLTRGGGTGGVDAFSQHQTKRLCGRCNTPVVEANRVCGACGLTFPAMPMEEYYVTDEQDGDA